MFVMRAEVVDVVSGLPYSMGDEHRWDAVMPCSTAQFPQRCQAQAVLEIKSRVLPLYKPFAFCKGVRDVAHT